MYPVCQCTVFVMYATMQCVCSTCVSKFCVCGVNMPYPCLQYSILSSLLLCRSQPCQAFLPPRLGCLGTCAYLSDRDFRLMILYGEKTSEQKLCSVQCTEEKKGAMSTYLVTTLSTSHPACPKTEADSWFWHSSNSL